MYKSVPSIAVLALAAAASAQITSVGVFTGQYSENFQTFSTYGMQSPGNGPLAILSHGGGSTIGTLSTGTQDASTGLFLYADPSDASHNAFWFALGKSGYAQAPGDKGIGNNDAFLNSTTEIINLSTPMAVFGGYFQDGASQVNGNLTTFTMDFTFFDGSGKQIGGDNFFTPDNSNKLNWAGFKSSTLFSKVEISGYIAVLDNLQTGMVVPEPCSIGALALGVVALVRRRRANRS